MFLPMSWTSPLTVARTILPCVLATLPGRDHRRLLGLHERRQVGDRLLHHARRLDHLRQEHLAGAEQVADHAHAVHQRPFDDQQRPAQLGARLFGVGVDVGVDALDQRVGEALLDRAVAPLLGLLGVDDFAGAGRLQLVAVLDQALGRVGAAIEQHVLDQHLQLGLDLLVDLEHPGVDDAHVHAGGDRVVEERRVHRLAHLVVAAEAERDVRDAAADLRVRQVGLDPARGVDEVDRVVVVLLHAGGDGEDVRIEDDVLGREADLVDEDAVGALADADLVLVGRGLALLVEGHHHHRRAVLEDGAGVLRGTAPRLPSARSS